MDGRSEQRCGRSVVDPDGESRRGDEEGAAVRCAVCLLSSALEGENARTASISFICAATVSRKGTGAKPKFRRKPSNLTAVFGFYNCFQTN